MRNACLFSVPKAVIVADKTYSLCSTYVTTTTFKFFGVIRRNSGDCPSLLGLIMLYTKSDSECNESFFSHLRRILKLHEVGPDARIFIGSDDERALSKPAADAVPEAIHMICLNHLKKTSTIIFQGKKDEMKPKEERSMGYYLEKEGLFSAKMKMSLKKNGMIS